MHRYLRRLLVVTSVGLLAACGRDTTAPLTDDLADRGTPRAQTNLVCVYDYAGLVQLANDVFGAGSPNVQSVLGKLQNLQQQLSNGNVATAKERAHDIVDFTLTKDKEKGLAGTPQQIAAFATGVYCFAGLEIVVSDPSNSTLIFPDDPEQIVYNAPATAGVKFPAFPVVSPTLIVFETLTSAPLNTKLDQYPGFIDVSARSDVPNPFEGIEGFEAIVGVCAEAPAFLFDEGRLRLGHGASDGFEITPERIPAQEGIALACDSPAPALAGATASTADDGARRVRSPATDATLLPSASTQPAGLTGDIPGDEGLSLRSGGVGGTVREFSPFAPVDVELSFAAGGVGGTVREFLRMPFLFGDASSLGDADPCDTNVFRAPIGTSVSCRPTVSVITFQRLLSLVRGETVLRGNAFENVPVQWSVVAGGGTIAPTVETECGATFATTLAATTAPVTGSTSVCWRLGLTPGTNTLRAIASVGGEVPEGVTFDAGGLEEFTATAVPPSLLTIDTVPPAQVVAGEPFTVVVRARDADGTRVMGYGGAVTLSLTGGTFADGTSTATVVADRGRAVFSLVITTAKPGYSVSVAADFDGVPLAGASSAPFAVVPAAAASLTVVAGDGQSVPSGTVVPIAPVVRLADAYDNPIAGATIAWTATLSSTGTVSPATSQTDANGRATTVWTVGDGSNELVATFDGVAPPLIATVMATGTTTLAVLNSCPVGSSGDPINDPSKPFAFFIANPGMNKTVRTVELYFSATGKANRPAVYDLELVTQVGTFDPNVFPGIPTRASVVLRGNASEAAAATFTLAQPIAGTSGRAAPPIMFTVKVLNNPDNATVRFNTGPCSPGSKCRVPKGCAVTQVSSPLPYPFGTAYRQSMGIVVKGS